MTGVELKKGVAKGGRGQTGREVGGEEGMRAGGKETHQDDA